MDWKLLKHSHRQSVTCDNSEEEDAFVLDQVPMDELAWVIEGEGQPSDSSDTEQRWMIYG